MSGSVSTSPTPQSNSNDSSFTGGLVVGWEVDLFGKLRRMNEASRASWLASEAGRNAVVSQLVAQVATTWFTIRELRAEEAELPLLETGDLLTLHPVGAYNSNQSMQFIFGRPAMVMITKDGQPELIRRAESLEDIAGCERVPKHLAGG